MSPFRLGLRAARLAALCTLGSAVAQPAEQPVDTTRATPSVGEVYVYADLFGSGVVLSLNLEHRPWRNVVVRGGAGILPSAVVVGVSFVPGEGTYRPEVGLSATGFLESSFPFDEGLWPGLFLGMRFHTDDGSLMRLGATLFVRPDLEGFGLWGTLPWPSAVFGGRL